MKVSKNSWHYRFNEYMQADFSYRANSEVFSTCSYARTTIFSLIVGLCKTFIMTGVGLLFMFLIAGMVYVPLFVFGLVPLVDPFMGFGIVGWVFIGLMVITHLFDRATPFLNERKQRRMTLMKQTLQDKKDGVCTLVEFE